MWDVPTETFLLEKKQTFLLAHREVGLGGGGPRPLSAQAEADYVQKLASLALASPGQEHRTFRTRELRILF